MKHSAPGLADHQMLAARFVTGPHVLAPDKAEQILGGWLADLAPEQSAALAALTVHPLARTILLGLAEFSPYLFDLIRDDADRAIRLLRCEPQSHLATLIETTSREVLAATNEADVMRLLRHMKSEAALLIALCDIGGVWPVMQVTAALTEGGDRDLFGARGAALPPAPGSIARPVVAA